MREAIATTKLLPVFVVILTRHLIKGLDYRRLSREGSQYECEEQE